MPAKSASQDSSSNANVKRAYKKTSVAYQPKIQAPDGHSIITFVVLMIVLTHVLC